MLFSHLAVDEVLKFWPKEWRYRWNSYENGVKGVVKRAVASGPMVTVVDGWMDWSYNW
jgi:hypothetical protein